VIFGSSVNEGMISRILLKPANIVKHANDPGEVQFVAVQSEFFSQG